VQAEQVGQVESVGKAGGAVVVHLLLARGRALPRRFPPTLYHPALSPCLTLFLLGEPTIQTKLIKIFLISAVQFQLDFCRETPRGPNSWFHVFPPRPNSRGFTSRRHTSPKKKH